MMVSLAMGSFNFMSIANFIATRGLVLFYIFNGVTKKLKIVWCTLSIVYICLNSQQIPQILFINDLDVP